MLTRWTVLDYVAHRYGKLEEVFDQDEKRLQLARDGIIKPASLESNPTRIAQRMARTFVPQVGIERILGVSDFQDVMILDKIREKSRSVCRLLKRGTPIGTGFLITQTLIITNHHVISNERDAEDMVAEFDFELDETLIIRKTSKFRLSASEFFLTSTLEKDQHDPHSGLDFTIIGLEESGTDGESISKYNPMFLDGNLGKIVKGECCVVIQHPTGLPKKVVLTGNAFFSETPTSIVYESDTLPGSSGAAVIALGTGEIIALHHCGLPRTDDQNRIITKFGTLATANTDDNDIEWIGNQGIKVSCIVDAIRHARLIPAWEGKRAELLRTTERVAIALRNSPAPDKQPVPGVADPITSLASTTFSQYPSSETSTTLTMQKADFILVAKYDPVLIDSIEQILGAQYSTAVQLSLVMPGTALPGTSELFSIQLPVTGNVHEQALSLTHIPGVEFAEADIPLALSADLTAATPDAQRLTESGIIDDGLGEWDEEQFLTDYAADSPYVKGKTPEQFRKWNWEATAFDKALQSGNVVSPREKGVRIVQFDTGYSDHSKIINGFDYELDFNFLDNSDDAIDPRSMGVLKAPGHGTRTGSILIGEEGALITNEGNAGLLANDDYKLVPYRIAETVVIINRQQQLAAALDRAIVQGFDIITMSMGIPPTITTAKLAKLAYDKGIIWCCAAGNEVQAVVAPAVFPGTIAVAASNPLDKPWTRSSRGDTVDITAPGEDVYVPIWNKSRQEDFAYGNGTSYATPHIAAAAAYWLAKHHDALSTPEYAGWKRVEAFRQALYQSARRKHHLPRGFGKGILNAEKLLQEDLIPAKNLKYAYKGYNEHAFLAVVQGYAELVKTFWNKLHGVFRRRKEESLFVPELSAFARGLEKTLPKRSFRATESASADPESELQERYNAVYKAILNTLN